MPSLLSRCCRRRRGSWVPELRRGWSDRQLRHPPHSSPSKTPHRGSPTTAPLLPSTRGCPGISCGRRPSSLVQLPAVWIPAIGETPSPARGRWLGLSGSTPAQTDVRKGMQQEPSEPLTRTRSCAAAGHGMDVALSVRSDTALFTRKSVNPKRVRLLGSHRPLVRSSLSRASMSVLPAMLHDFSSGSAARNRPEPTSGAGLGSNSRLNILVEE